MQDDRIAITRRATDRMARLFDALTARGEPRDRALRVVLQSVVAMFTGGAPPPARLTREEHGILAIAAGEDWSRVEPLIFGALFQDSIGKAERHALGAHFTSEREIQRVVQPTIVEPWTARIAAARTARDLFALHDALLRFRVLDPACGSGNFLYVAYRELVKIEARILARLPRTEPSVGVHQLFGIDVEPFAVELAKVELTLAAGRIRADALGANIVCDDALFCAWPPADAIIGNPPYQPKNKAQRELGAAYMAKLRERYEGVPGRADYCVYWFRRAHDELAPGGRAGLVGTNTIRENDSRKGGLDYIVGNGGTITEAVSTQVWPGAAVVHVSIVNWVKGNAEGAKVLWKQEGDKVGAPWRRYDLPAINAALSPHVDVTGALDLDPTPKASFQGQTPGHAAFVVGGDVAERWIREDAANAQVLFPYLIGDDLLDDPESAPRRWLIDFGERDLPSARRYSLPFAHIEPRVLPARERAAALEATRNAEVLRDNPRTYVNKHHRNFLARWWLPSYRREDMLAALSGLSRYIACSRVTRRPIFELVPRGVRPSDALQVFAFEDDYSFGLLQSDAHWQWFVARCSGLKGDPRYTSASVYSTFPWPQSPSAGDVSAVSEAGRALREERRAFARTDATGLRALYRRVEGLEEHPLKGLHADLDAAVRGAYGMKPGEDVLAFLLGLNREVASRLTAT